MPLTLLSFQLNAVNGAIFPVKCHEHHLFGFKAVKTAVFLLNAVNAAVFPLNDVKDGIITVKRI